MSDPDTTCAHCGVVEASRALLEFKHRRCAEQQQQRREKAAWAKYGGCTCMGHGECNFCRERK